MMGQEHHSRYVAQLIFLFFPSLYTYLDIWLLIQK